LKLQLSPLSILGSVVLGGVIFSLLIALLFWSRPTRSPVEAVTAALTVIPAPTASPTLVTVAVVDTPESTIPEGFSPNNLSVGSYVKVSGTAGLGLRLRLQPGLDAESQFLGVEDEIFFIEEGPKEADGYTWWFLVAPFEENRNGWAAANYLEIVQQP